VAGAELGEGVAEGVAGGIALGVVGHDGLGGAAAPLDKPGRGAREGGRDRLGVLGGVDLAGDQAGVVVDDSDDLDLFRAARLVGL
jgi:hypothetical protein